MQPLAEWIKSPEILKLKASKPGDLYSREFFRDPFRATYFAPEWFYSPADGVVIYAREDVGPDDAVITIKGQPYTPRGALDDKDYNERSLVIGIFMTQYDVHVNRVPTSGYVRPVHSTPYLFTQNISMKLEEDALTEDATVKKGGMDYLFRNERRIVSVVNPALDLKYYLIQIAEKDVDEILNFETGFFTQGERYGVVRFGSQVDIIVPLIGDNSYELLVKEKDHIEGGIDPIIRIVHSKPKETMSEEQQPANEPAAPMSPFRKTVPVPKDLRDLSVKMAARKIKDWERRGPPHRTQSKLP